MNIEELKKEHIENKSDKEELQKIKNSTLSLFGKLTDVDRKIQENCQFKCLGFMLNVSEEFKNYFEKKGFSVREDNPVVADFQGLEITLLQLDNDKEEPKFRLNIGDKKDNEFYIKVRLARKYKDMVSWSYQLGNRAFSVVDKQNGYASISACSHISDLENASEFLTNKIEQFNKILEEVNSFKFIYTTYEKDKIIDEYDKPEFDTFEELFEAL